MDTLHQGEELISFAQDEESVSSSPLSTISNNINKTAGATDKNRPLTPLAAPMEPTKVNIPLRSPQKRSAMGHARSYSWVAPQSPRKGGPSLSFPVSIAPPSLHHARIPQSASTSSPPISPFAPVDAIEPAADPEKFLTVLASQERRVLELREELTRADAELEKLKRKWALHEATRKRTENTTAGQTKAVRKSEEIPSSVKEARRKSAGTGYVNNTRRTTFSSNTRHQRTLSLLSPDRKNFHSFPQPADLWNEDASPSAVENVENLVKVQPNNMFESGYERSVYGSLDNLDRRRGGHQDALIATGKQMAEDFKEGLWTFIEDLRQATVGEEGSQGQETPKTVQTGTASNTSLKKNISKNNLKSPGTTPAKSNVKPKSTKTKSTVKATKLIDIGDDFWNELDPNGPLSATSEKCDTIDMFAEEMRSVKKSHIKAESTRWSSSTIMSDMASGSMTPDTSVSTPRTSTSSFSRSRSNSPSRKDSVGQQSQQQQSTAELLQSLADAHSQQQNAAWGVVVNPLGFNLKKTATAFLSQVEKSLAPPISAVAANTFDLPRTTQVTSSSKSKNH